MPSSPPIQPNDTERSLEPGRRRVDLAQLYRLRVMNRLSFGEIAKLTGHSKSTVHAALERLNKVVPDPEQVKAYEEVEPFLLTATKARLLDSLADPAAIEKASLNNRAFAFSQVAQQERLTKGMSTANLGLLGKLVVEVSQELFKEQKPGEG